MKLGDLVRLQLGEETKYGVVIQESKKMFMAGEVIAVLVDGEIRRVIKDKVSLVKVTKMSGSAE
tara:strand:- start:64 stop:255 length:192 start_codon:yes stop_codon:yes gene_type:complete